MNTGILVVLTFFDPKRLPLYLAFASVVAVLCSNSLSNVLIAVATLALLTCHFAFGHPLRFPPVKLPLCLFFLATLASVALSGHIRQAWPGPRKFYLCLVLLLVYSTFRSLREVRALIAACAAMVTASALWSLHQFLGKMHQASMLGQDFRVYYTVERITGFTSHWMTLSGEEMFVLLLISALLLFAPPARRSARIALAAAGLVVATGLLAAYTRSMWLGAALGGAWLLWQRNRKMLLLAPLPLLLLLWLNPAGIGARIVSAWRPAGDLDSNQFRVVCRRTAWEMIRAHPFFGLGPEQVKAQFIDYVPADIPRPLPTGAYMHLHNVYLQYAAERGVPALLAFLWWIGAMLWDFVSALRATPPQERERRSILLGVLAVMMAALTAGWYEHNLNDGEILTLFHAVCASGYLCVAEESGLVPTETRP